MRVVEGGRSMGGERAGGEVNICYVDMPLCGVCVFVYIYIYRY